MLTERIDYECPAASGVAITGYPSVGSVMAWSEGGRLWTASYRGGVAPFTPQALGPAWTVSGKPAVTFLAETGALYIAWTDADGYVHVASSADAWKPERFFNIGFEATGGTAMTHVPGTIYASYPWQDMIQIRSFAPDYGAVPDDPSTGLSAGGIYQLNGNTGVACDNGEHGLFALGDEVFVTTGGSVDKGAAPGRLFVAAGGQWFTEVTIPAFRCFGAPQMALVGDTYHLVWVDAADGMVTHAATRDLASFEGASLGVRSRGDVAMVGLPDGLVIGYPWTPDVRDDQHFVAFTTLPLAAEAGALDAATARLAPSRARRAQVKDCGPFQVYDSENDRCVDRSSPLGKCLLSSFMGNGLINPLSFAICMARS